MLLLDFSTKNPTHTVPTTTPVQTVVSHMLKTKIHRMALVDAKGRLEHLVTQSNLVEFALLNLDRL